MGIDSIRIGTRSSKLAMWQTEYIVGLLRQNGIHSEVLQTETKGDKILDVSISKIGSKGVFTEELEYKLKNGEIDIAIHSAKDLQSNLDDDLSIIAFDKREDPSDVIISTNQNINIKEDGIKIGTSSTRRVALFKKHYPQIELTDMRGNLQTRISKMKQGVCDALILAYAGVHRMGFDEMIVDHLAVDQFVPAVGQGSIALEASSSLSDEKRDLIRATVNDIDTETCIRAERAFLKKLEGGCSIPVFGLAQLSSSSLNLRAGIISLDGTKKIQLEKEGNPELPEELGLQVAEELLQSGGLEILNEIKKSL